MNTVNLINHFFPIHPKRLACFEATVLVSTGLPKSNLVCFTAGRLFALIEGFYAVFLAS
jgi:hypothetical protein